MATNPNTAKTEYDAAVKALNKFCEDHTDFEAYILDDDYPIRVQFLPNSQLTLFGNENIDENGEVNDLTVTVGLNSDVRSTLKYKMDVKLLKKLIKLAENVGHIYYHAFREQEGGRITPRRPFMKAMDGFTAEEASVLVCPNCEHPVVNQWAPGTNPVFCQGCGQKLDWTMGVEEDEKELGKETTK